MEDLGYRSDLPVIEKAQDRFSRWSFAERVAQVISRRNDPSSIVIGLYGKWGDGKTSVLNFIEKSLENEPHVICIKFNPWRFGTEDDLLTGFFFGIAEALDTKLLTKEDTLKTFLKGAITSSSELFGTPETGRIISACIPQTTINELKQRIEDRLLSAQKRVLIQIDDVDRLEKTEIHALFRLVKLTADFKYTAYILAFDKEIVAAALQDRYAHASENAGAAFLEKIIQVPLDIPAVEKQVLRGFCFQGVSEALTIANIELTQAQINRFSSEFSFAFDDCLTTPRKAKLYANTLIFSLPILKDEVNPVDLMLLEGIRVFYPPLYEFIKVNKALFTGTFIGSFRDNNDNEKEQIKGLVDEALNSGKSINKEGFIGLLKMLFPKLDSVYGSTIYRTDWYEIWNNDQRICSEHYFSRYFAYAVPVGDFSDSEIQDLLDSFQKFDINNNPLDGTLNASNADTLIKKLRQKANSINPEVSASLAISLAQKSSNLPNPEILNSWGTPFAQAAILVSHLIQNVKKPERVALAKSCITKTPSLEFKLEIFKWLKKEDEDKPEMDAFSNASVDKIGKHLGQLIDTQLKKVGDITTTEPEPKSIPDIFYILKKYMDTDYVNQYVAKLVADDPTVIIRVLDAYVPTSWDMESGVPHKSDFERKQYNSLTEELDAAIVLSIIQKHFPESVAVSDEFPRVYYEDVDKEFLFLQQFVWLHNHVIDESKEKTSDQ